MNNEQSVFTACMIVVPIIKLSIQQSVNLKNAMPLKSS